MKIDEIIWKGNFVEKIKSKHRVTISEVEDILHGRKKVYRVAKGDVAGENVYLALGKTSAGRHLSVFYCEEKS